MIIFTNILFPFTNIHGGYSWCKWILYVQGPKNLLFLIQYVTEYTSRTYMGDIKISKEFETNTSTTYNGDKDVKGLTNNH